MKNRNNPVHVISLGGGVQSTTIALMAAAGIISPMPKLAVFADTQSESAATYDHLARVEKLLPFPIVRTTFGDLGENSLALKPSPEPGKKYVDTLIPAFFERNGKRMLMHRRCTARYKVHPIRRIVRQFFKEGVVQWIGISTDEASRMRDEQVKYVQNRYPLIELGMSRQDCIDWLISMGYDVPEKSACLFCPFHSDDYWLHLKTNSPQEFAATVEYEKRMQASYVEANKTDTKPFLHRSLQPLNLVQLERGKHPSLFSHECGANCGV